MAVAPPPATVTAGVAAMAPAMARVPAANAASSKRPIGPYQNTVAAAAISAAYRAAVVGTDVEAHPAVGHINPVPHPRRDALLIVSPGQQEILRKLEAGNGAQRRRWSASRAGSRSTCGHSELPTRRVLGPRGTGSTCRRRRTPRRRARAKAPDGADLASEPGATDDRHQRPFGPVRVALRAPTSRASRRPARGRKLMGDALGAGVSAGARCQSRR